MAKKKKFGNIQSKTSESALIKERARKLQIDKCLITANWKENGLASVMITRKHANDNITVGFFEVDLYLKGVKDCFGRFNIPKYILDDDLKQHPQDFEEINYNLAHNIIYGSIEFAEDYGFHPHKEWKICQYILEEDDDNIPLINIEFGKDGKPVLFDHESTWQRDLKILEKTAGEGNFYFITGFEEEENEDDWDFDENDPEYDDMDDLEEEDDNLAEEIINANFIKYVGEKNMRSEKALDKFLNKAEKDSNHIALAAFINKTFYEIEGYKYFEDLPLIEFAIGEIEILDNDEFYRRFYDEVNTKKKNKKNIGDLDLIEKYPDFELSYFFCFFEEYANKNTSEEKLLEMAEELVNKYPKSLAAKSNNLLWLAFMEKDALFLKMLSTYQYVESILEMTDGIDTNTYINFCIIRSYEYIFKDDLENADRFYIASKAVEDIDEHPYFYFIDTKMTDLKSNFMENNYSEKLSNYYGNDDNVIHHKFK